MDRKVQVDRSITTPRISYPTLLITYIYFQFFIFQSSKEIRVFIFYDRSLRCLYSPIEVQIAILLSSRIIIECK